MLQRFPAGKPRAHAFAPTSFLAWLTSIFCARVSDAAASQRCSGICTAIQHICARGSRSPDSLSAHLRLTTKKAIKSSSHHRHPVARRARYIRQSTRNKKAWPPKQQPPTPCRPTPTSRRREEDETRPARPSTTSSRRSTCYAPHRRTRLPQQCRRRPPGGETSA